MRKLVERSIEAVEWRLLLLAPPGAAIGEEFRHTTVNRAWHRALVRDVQRLRGAVYLADGAIKPHQLTPDGRHQTPEDERAWHLLLTNDEGEVAACLWYLQHDARASFRDLRVSNSPLARDAVWGDKVWLAVESDMARARAEGVRYSEAGGWAVGADDGCACDGLLLALAAFGLSRQLGGPRAMTTATVRHGSAAILRRLGGSSFFVSSEEIPPYFDSRYGCTMELLRFDARRPNPRYAPFVDMIQRSLLHARVIAPVAPPVPEPVPVGSPVFGTVGLSGLRPALSI